MRKMTTVTTFIQDLSYLLDKDESCSLQEVKRHIEDKDVIGWLEQKYPFGSEKGLDFSLFKESHREYIHESLYKILGGYDGQERRKWGIENNGLALLVSWSIEVVRDIDQPGKEWIED